MLFHLSMQIRPDQTRPDQTWTVEAVATRYPCNQGFKASHKVWTLLEASHKDC